VQKPTIDKNTFREQLKTERNLLFNEYCENTQNTRLAIEIRLIDDQLGGLTQHLVQQTKSDPD
jgi:hypothetical protein